MGDSFSIATYQTLPLLQVMIGAEGSTKTVAMLVTDVFQMNIPPGMSIDQIGRSCDAQP